MQDDKAGSRMTDLSLPEKVALLIALVPIVVIAYSVPAIALVGVYHWFGWLCCGVPL